MVIKLILGSENPLIVDIKDETPMLVILRDLFYSGDWRNMKKILKNIKNFTKISTS